MQGHLWAGLHDDDDADTDGDDALDNVMPPEVKGVKAPEEGEGP